MGDLPEGVVTLLFTDVEGSTLLLNKHPDQYRRAVRRHHDLLLEAVHLSNGAVFETVGDAVYAAFARPTDAVKAALRGQLALQQEEWGETPIRVRMGVHLGEVELQVSDGRGHYFGAPLYRCARLMSTAHGGQVVLSEAVTSIVRATLPDGASLRDLGDHRLKDLTRPERVVQLVHPELADAFPPLRSLSEHTHNLPIVVTPFIGRESVVADALGRLGSPDVRLLTLTGPGGTGKTRLGLQVAAEALSEYPQGVTFVPLASVADESLVVPTIAQSLGVPDVAGRTRLEGVCGYLREKRLLLVLDNFEHVVDAAAHVGVLLAACPHIKVVATSRIALHVYGEHEFPVPPLALPRAPRAGESSAALAARVSQYEAVRLFVERARGVRPDFHVTNENAPAVAELCARLDGLPLAIELAAARVKLLPPQTLLDRLGAAGRSSSLHLLSGGARDLPARQQTLHNAIAWSYDLLSGEEQALFRRLGIFARGFTLESAEALCEALHPALPDAGIDALEGVASLVDKSLIKQLEDAEGEPRFLLLETIRAFALEQLAASGEADAVRAAHGALMLDIAVRGAPELHGPHLVTWLNRLDAELDNFRQTLGWAAEEPAQRGPLGLQLAAALGWFWFVRGYWNEGRGHLDAALGRAPHLTDPASAVARARAFTCAGYIAMNQGELVQGTLQMDHGVVLYEQTGDATGLGWALGTRAFAAVPAGDPQAGLALAQRGRAVAEAGGHPWSAVYCQFVAWWIAPYVVSDPAQLAAIADDALAACRRVGAKWLIPICLSGQAWASLTEGNAARAAALSREALALERGIGEKLIIIFNADFLAAAEVAHGHVERAARLFGFVDALAETIDYRWWDPKFRTTHDGAVAKLRRLGDAAEVDLWWAEGRNMTQEQGLDYALERQTEPARV